jgi:hypothetical protein
MNTSFILSGGAGRVIASIPALEKFHRLNPNDDFKVFVHGWESLFWSHPLLQQRTFSIGQKGVFDQFIRHSNLIAPEPYDRRSFYTQQKSLAEAIDEEINNTNDHSDLTKPNIFLQKQEMNSINFILQEKKKEKRKNKVIVFQPYGSGIRINNGRPIDTSIRSIDVDDYLKIGKELSKEALVVFFGEKDYVHPGDDFSFKPAVDLQQIDLRFWASCIAASDYFVGCDSVGQHMAYSFNKPGTVIMGSTFEKNVSYPEHFKIYRNGLTPTYSPIRIGGVDCEFADRANDNLMDFTSNQITELTKVIMEDINGKNSSNGPTWRW